MAEVNLPSRLALLLRCIALFLAYTVGVCWAIIWLARQPVQFFHNPSRYLRNFPVKKRRTPPSILRNSEFGQHGYLQLLNGMRIHYVAAGDEKQPLMLLLHGFPDFWFSWRNQIKHFSAGYRVVAVDLRGYGDSSKPRAVEAYELSQLVEDIKLIIEGFGRKSCVLVGHDWGGVIAWAFATHLPVMVDKLITLNSPHPKVAWNFALKNPKQLVMSWYKFVFQLPWFPEFVLRHNDFQLLDDLFMKPPMGMKPGCMTVDELEAYKYTFSPRNALTPPVNYYRNIFRVHPDQTFCWRPIRCPVLVIFGTADHFIRSETALLSGQYAAGQFEVKYLDGISHWVHLEAPDQVNRAMDHFLGL